MAGALQVSVEGKTGGQEPLGERVESSQVKEGEPSERVWHYHVELHRSLNYNHQSTPRSVPWRNSCSHAR